MKKIKILAMTMLLAMCTAFVPVSAQEDQNAAANPELQEIVGKIVQIDVENSTIDLEYELDDQTHQMQTETFYVTEETTIDVARVKSDLSDLKAGTQILLEYAQMPDGAKVVESVWVKES